MAQPETVPYLSETEPTVQRPVWNCGHTELLQVLIPDMLKERKTSWSLLMNARTATANRGFRSGVTGCQSVGGDDSPALWQPVNEHKKLITFSDSVQDAAHRPASLLPVPGR